MWEHLRCQQSHRKLVRQLVTLQRCHRRTAHADQSVAVDLACPSCLDVLRVPTLLWPCGHTFCPQCAAAMLERNCGVCDAKVERTVRNPAAAAVCLSFHSRQAAMEETRELLEKYAGA